jgi:hypothetical protein
MKAVISNLKAMMPVLTVGKPMSSADKYHNSSPEMTDMFSKYYST